MLYSVGYLRITAFTPFKKLVGYCRLYITVGKKQTRKVKPLGKDHIELLSS